MKYFFVFEGDLPGNIGIRWMGKEHIFWLLLCAATVLCLCVLGRRLTERRFRALQLALGVLILLCELNRQLCLLSAGARFLDVLPLHLCSMSVFLVLWHCAAGGVLLGELLYCLTMPGAFSAVLFPDWLYYPALNLLSIGTFLGHVLLTAYPAMLVSRGAIRPAARRLPKCFACLVGVSAVIFVFNRCTGTDFFFLNGPAPGSPLEWFAEILGDPGYIAGFLPIIAAVWLALYLPLLRRRR